MFAWHTVFFLLFAVLACGFALAVVLAKNVVRMAFYLVLSLSATSGLFFLAGADFVGAMQLMIYVGGTLVLLIFGVMLTAQEKYISITTRPTEAALALVAGGALLLLLISAALRAPDWQGQTATAESLDTPPHTAGPLAMGLLGMRPDLPEDAEGPRTGYLLIFEIVSIHLLVVLVGAAYLARARVSQETLDFARPPDEENLAGESTS